MPSIADAPNPSANPGLYPGPPVPGDCLLAGTWRHPLSGTILDDEGGPLAGLSLDDALAALDAAPMSARRPIAAIGSNAAAGQLLHKWGGAVDAVPMMRATASGIGVGHSAHVSAAGYVPYAPVAAPGRRTTVFVLWLDEKQVERLDATEPNYVRTTVGAAGSLTLDVGGTPNSWELYRSRWGALGGRDGFLPAADQATAMARLAAWGLTAHLPAWPDIPRVQAGLAADAAARAALRRALAGFARPDGLADYSTSVAGGASS